jgi:hypothetical protein
MGDDKQKIADDENVAVDPLDDDTFERLMALQTECAVLWSTRDGWPVASRSGS